MVTVSAEYFDSLDHLGMVSTCSALHYEVELIDFTKVGISRSTPYST